jgi:formate dehydrogenase subunit gamma
MAEGTAPERLQRYVPAQRAIHWIGVGSFAALLGSGLVLLPPFAGLAAGGWSRLVHRAFALPFMALPVAYLVLIPHEARALLSETLRFGPQDRAWLLRMPTYVLGITRGLPPQGRINAGQKIHHAATFAMFVTVAASGLVLWFGKGQLGAAGLAAAAIVHDLSMMGLAVLMIGHVYFTFLYGALPAMETGWISAEYARLEHRAWYDEVTGGRGTPPVDGAPRR